MRLIILTVSLLFIGFATFEVLGNRMSLYELMVIVLLVNILQTLSYERLEGMERRRGSVKK